MSVSIIILGSIFSLLSSAVISYISMATMVGPWIAPTIVLMTSMIFKFTRMRNGQEMTTSLALVQTIGSVGGIIAMGIGFTLPTLYFLDPELFAVWLKNPVYFCTLIGTTCLAAGSLGMWLGRMMRDRLVLKEKLAFPVSTMIHKTITSQSQGLQAKRMMLGFSSSAIFCLLRDGFLGFKGLLPKTLFFFSGTVGKALPFALWPTLWAIGFTTGSVVALPLLVGMVSKYVVLAPLNSTFFSLGEENFTMAFCSGLVVAEVVAGLRGYPKIISKTLKGVFGPGQLDKLKERFTGPPTNKSGAVAVDMAYRGGAVLRDNREASFAILSSMLLLSYLGFSLPAQVLLLVLVSIATYQIAHLSARVGLVPFGRFATFVMLPMMLLFGLSSLQLTMVCVFANICFGVATDLLFDYKVGNLCSVSEKRIHRAQWLGLLITSVTIGFFLWLLFVNFDLGSAELCAQRGRSRALLIQSTGFNYWVMICGAIFGMVIKKLKVSPALTLGGILMPNSISIGLVLGGMTARLTKQNEGLGTFWSGVFASESLWILVRMLLKLFGG